MGKKANVILVTEFSHRTLETQVQSIPYESQEPYTIDLPLDYIKGVGHSKDLHHCADEIVIRSSLLARQACLSRLHKVADIHHL